MCKWKQIAFKLCSSIVSLLNKIYFDLQFISKNLTVEINLINVHAHCCTEIDSRPYRHGPEILLWLLLHKTGTPIKF